MLENHNSEEQVLPIGYVLSSRYVLDSFLGSGGMGSVYLCRDTLLEDKVVAVKILHREFARDVELTRRFLREVNMMHSVNHPNVVRTFDAGVENGIFYFTMEFVEGLLLDEYLEAAGRDYTLLGRITAQICKGLEAIHGQNIVHRDLKPGNILVSESGFVKITDFGVARPISSGNTTHREIMGSLDYIPPEVFQGLEITPASDFYSLGVILYGIVTGEFPFEADDPMAIVWKHVHEEARPPRELCEDIPPWLDVLIMGLLSKDPKERPQSAREIIRLVRGGLYSKEGSSLDSGSYKVSTGETLGEFSQRDSTIFDTDSFELGMNSTERAREYFDDLDHEESDLTVRESSGAGVDNFNSAWHQVIFDALPTGDAIRKHEQEWQEKSRLRSDVGLAAEMQEPEKKRDFRTLKIAFITIFLFSLLSGGLFLFFKILPEIEQREEELRPKSIEELKKEYYSESSKKSSKANNSTSRIQKSSTGVFTQSRAKESSFFDSVTSLFKKSSNTSGYNPSGPSLQPSAPTVYETNRPLTQTASRSHALGGSRKRNPSISSRLSSAIWAAPQVSSRPRKASFEEEELSNLYSSNSVEKFDVSSFKKKNPKVKSSVFDIFFGGKKEKITLRKGTPSELAFAQRKSDARSRLREVAIKQEVLSFESEAELTKLETQSKSELEELREAVDYVSANFTKQSHRQDAWSSLLKKNGTRDLLETAKNVSGINPQVKKQYSKYIAIESEYREILDLVSSGQTNAETKKKANQVGGKLAREREKLRAYVNSTVSNSISEEKQSLADLGEALSLLKMQEVQLEKNINDRRKYWRESKKGKTFNAEELLKEKKNLENLLANLEQNLDEAREQELRRSEIVEALDL